MHSLQIEEATVGTLGDMSVGVGNIWPRQLEGEELKRLSARLSYWYDSAPGETETELFVSQGSVIDFGEEGQWVVTDIDAGAGDNGHIILERRP